MSRVAAEHDPELYVDVVGDPLGPPVLLLHGGGVAGWMWRPLLDEFGSEDRFRFLVPDLPGHDHGAGEPYVSHDRTTAALASLLEQRASGPAIVVGFSLGAQLAVSLACRRPDLVARVMVISAQAKPTRWPAATLAMLGMAAPLARSERFARAQARELFVPAALMPDYLRTSRSLSRRTLLASVGENIRFTIPSGWATYAGKALVLVGSKERAMMRESGRLLARARAGEAEIVDGCGHGIPLQRPEWLARRVRDWLR